MIEVKETKFLIKENVEFIAKKYKTLNNSISYEYYLFFKDLSKNLFPPQSLTDAQIKMSVQDYKDFGRHEWFDFVKLSHYKKAFDLLNE